MAIWHVAEGYEPEFENVIARFPGGCPECGNALYDLGVTPNPDLHDAPKDVGNLYCPTCGMTADYASEEGAIRCPPSIPEFANPGSGYHADCPNDPASACIRVREYLSYTDEILTSYTCNACGKNSVGDSTKLTVSKILPPAYPDPVMRLAAFQQKRRDRKAKAARLTEAYEMRLKDKKFPDRAYRSACPYCSETVLMKSGTMQKPAILWCSNPRCDWDFQLVAPAPGRLPKMAYYLSRGYPPLDNRSCGKCQLLGVPKARCPIFRVDVPELAPDGGVVSYRFETYKCGYCSRELADLDEMCEIPDEFVPQYPDPIRKLAAFQQKRRQRKEMEMGKLTETFRGDFEPISGDMTPVGMLEDADGLPVHVYKMASPGYAEWDTWPVIMVGMDDNVWEKLGYDYDADVGSGVVAYKMKPVPEDDTPWPARERHRSPHLRVETEEIAEGPEDGCLACDEPEGDISEACRKFPATARLRQLQRRRFGDGERGK